MGYDRYDSRGSRDDRSRWSGDRDESRDRGGREERGFFERAGDEIASWFGDDDNGRQRREEHGEGGFGPRDRESGRGRASQGRGHEQDRGREWSRGQPPRNFSEDRDHHDRDEGRGYRPMAGDYGRAEQSFGGGRQRDYERERRFERDRSDSEWGRDPYRQTSRAGSADWSDRSRHEDPHYSSWRHRHMSELDRDYDDYRRENQSRFEDDFTGWRERRQQKRGLLGQIREHMEVVGSDDQHVGTVDKAAGDRIILTKSDPESGGAHHSLSCSDIDRVEGDRVILGCSAEQARRTWRDESRNRALFEREDSGEMGPRMLDRSFEGTYRR
jgi:hypothetical protein